MWYMERSYEVDGLNILGGERICLGFFISVGFGINGY